MGRPMILEAFVLIGGRILYVCLVQGESEVFEAVS